MKLLSEDTFSTSFRNDFRIQPICNVVTGTRVDFCSFYQVMFFLAQSSLLTSFHLKHFAY